MTSNAPGTTADVAIVGGGFAGLTLALALVRSLGAGFEVIVLDKPAEASGDRGEDPRAVAISATSRHLLEAIGVWPALAPVAQRVTRIEITDSSLDAGLRPVLLAWDNDVDETAGPSAAAHIVPLPALTAALEAEVARERAIVLRRPAETLGLQAGQFDARISLVEGAPATARLGVAADGMRSRLREAAGIKSVGWPYSQLGIATAVEHEAEHGGVAIQHFLPGGPFAILPLTGRRCCVTWTESEADGRRIMGLDDAGFLAELERRFGGRLGRLRLAGGRRAWPLSMHLARSYVAPRLVLIGDAAHGVHPIAGQGLNLAFRDVAALAEVLADAARTGLDIGSVDVLERYERWRRFDSMLAAGAFDALNRLFSRDSRLQVFDRLPALKRLAIGEAAGTSGELPRLLRGELA